MDAEPHSRPRPDETLRPALEALAARDSDIARHYALCGLPPERRRPLGFAGLAQIVAAQQVSAASANAIIGRLEAALRPVTAEGFLELDDGALKAIGLSRPKMRYCRALAEDLLAGRIDLDGLAGLDDEAAIEHLVQAKGIGVWSAEIYLLFALRRARRLAGRRFGGAHRGAADQGPGGAPGPRRNGRAGRALAATPQRRRALHVARLPPSGAAGRAGVNRQERQPVGARHT